MLSQVLINHNMDSDAQTGWLPMNLASGVYSKNTMAAYSLQICWSGIEGTADGKIDLLVSNDMKSYSTARTINVFDSENPADAVLVLLKQNFAYLKIIYSHNEISAGELNVNLNYLPQ